MTSRIPRERLEAIADTFGENNCTYDDGRWHIADLDRFSEAVLEEPNPLKSRIAHGFYRALELLGGQSDILAVAGSYGDTMPDDHIADMLEQWVEYEMADRAKAKGKE